MNDSLVGVETADSVPKARPLKRWKLCTLLKCTCRCGRDKFPSEIPIYHSSICSLINYTWLTPFIWRTYRKGRVDSKDIWPYPAADACDIGMPKWERCVQAEIERQHIDRLNSSPQLMADASDGMLPAAGGTQTSSPVVQESRIAEKEPVLNIVWAVLRFQLVTLFSVLFLRLATLVVVIMSALFGLQTLIREVEDGNMDIVIGVVALVGLVFLLLCKSLLWSQAYCIGGIAGLRLRGAVLALCLQKLLKSKSLLSIRPTITNIFANDSRTFLDFATQLTTLFSAFAMIIAVSVCGFFIVGPWSLMATAVFVVYIPVEFSISSIIMRYRRRAQHLSDQRLDTMRELLASIKLVKFLSVETFFYRRILLIWRQQIRCLRMGWLLSSLSVSLAFTVPLLASVCTFLPHILLGNSLTATQAFVFVGLWAAARSFVHMISTSMKGLNDARVAAYRLSRIFYLPEMSPLPDVDSKDSTEEEPVVIQIKDLSAAYSRAPKGLRKPTKHKHRESRSKTRKRGQEDKNSEEQTDGADANGSLIPANPNQLTPVAHTDSDAGSENPTTPSHSEKASRRIVLSNLNLEVRRGQIIGVCGRVGSGKSSLLNAILGRLDVLSGSLAVTKGATTAVVMQDAWLFHGSIRENIVFGKMFDPDRYWAVIQNCGLVLDLDLMEHGDATEVTEYGANLSGGQKQRVCLARALYAGADLLLLDDPLSAIDNNLSQQIFEDGLLSLKGSSTTVIFVSHRLEFLIKCDRIMVMHDGTISESGTHAELIAKPGGEYLSLVQSFYRRKHPSVVGDEEDLPEEEEEAFNLDRITSLVSRAAAGLYMDEHPWADMSVPIAQRRQPELGLADSITATVGAKVLLAKTPEEENVTLPVKKASRQNNASQKLNTPQAVGDKTEDGDASATKRLVADSIFQSRPDFDSSKRGYVAFSVYKTYAKAAGRYFWLLLVILGYIITHGLVAFTKYWLANWLKEGSGTAARVANWTEPIVNDSSMELANDSMAALNADADQPLLTSDLSKNPNLHFYALVYICSAFAVLTSAVIKSCFVALFALRASHNLHKKLLSCLLSCPLSFFERTKSGTIITRFAKDIDELTTKLPASLECLLSNLSVMLTASIAICYVLPWFIFCCLGMLIVAILVFRVAQAALRDLRRVEAYSLQPLLGLLTSVVSGAPTIGAFGRAQLFLVRASALINRTSAVMLMLQLSGRWLSWRLDVLVNLVIGVTGTLVLFLRHHLPPAFAGLALSMVIEIAGILQVATRMFLNTETNFVAVERLTTFQNRLPRENLEPFKSRYVPEPPKPDRNGKCIVVNDSETPLPELPRNWPPKGAISFEGITLSYGEDDPNVMTTLALDDVTFDVHPGEYMAVVGRSGSGKSSIASVLTRLYAISSGRVVIDGFDIADVPLSELRKSISVVPQDPVLFSGTIRSNLDPYREHSDDELWAALERCAMKDRIQERAARHLQSTESMTGGEMFLSYASISRNGLPTVLQPLNGKQSLMPAALDMTLNSNDVRFSTGERQLLCLARALVRDSAILILDEATASIDAETESRIHATLNVEAHKRTIITIIHRLETIVSPTSRCDRVLVMEAGRVAEIVDAQTMRKRNADATHFTRMALSGKDI